MGSRKVTPKLERVLLRRMSKDRKGKIHRPTVAVMVEHFETRKFLIVYGRQDLFSQTQNPGIVKGGVDKGEKPIEAARREIYEELGALPHHFEFLSYYGSYSVESKKQKEGFPRKRYYVFHAIYTGPFEFQIDMDELSHYEWVTLGEARQSLRSLKEHRGDKHKVLLKIFARVKKKKPKRKTKAKP